ncbi:YihY/virulence factor BrkB family protein [Amaricoccus macauensis]|uniref:YihY/virulence factor BrkB family protein n=1 Tax=Amaricoccus macauensis TaxID=57001 RepID=UPI003C7A10EC
MRARHAFLKARRFFLVLWDAIRRFNRNDGAAMAGFVAFSCLLSIFPFLIFATALTGLIVGPDNTDAVIEALFEIAPEHMARTLEPVVGEVLQGRSNSVLTISVLFAIYVASNAVDSIRMAFDRAYLVRPDPFFLNRIRAIGFVMVGAIVAALLGFTILLSPLLIRLATELLHVQVPGITGYLTYAFGLAVFVSFAWGMHRFLPGRRLSRSIRLWPGVILTALLWIIAATAFSTYLSYAPSYAVTYGTLAGVIITLMFFYITGMVIIFGAEFNAALNRMQPDGS